MEVVKVGSVCNKLEMSDKQLEILSVLEDNTHVEVFAGGAALSSLFSQC